MEKVDNYLAFAFEEFWFQAYDHTGSYQDLIDFVYHEGFHFFPQEEFKAPKNPQFEYRFNIPEDYPHDVEFFTLIYAGHKIAQLLKETTDPAVMLDYMKMYYTIFNRLITNDQSGKDYISGYFLSFFWMEGLTTYVGKLFPGNKSYFISELDTDPFESFERTLNYTIDNELTSININGEEVL